MTDASRKVGGRPRGKVSSFTPDRIARILARHAAGEWLGVACAEEGVSREGMRLARQRDPAVDEAASAATMRCAKVHIEALAASEDWKAHAHYLEKLLPDEWGKAVGGIKPVEVYTGGVVERQVIIMTEAQMRERARASMRASSLPALPASGTVDPEGDE